MTAPQQLTDEARAWAAEDPDDRTRAELEAVIAAAERGEETDLADRFAGTSSSVRRACAARWAQVPTG